jgi:hypothetical protein
MNKTFNELVDESFDYEEEEETEVNIKPVKMEIANSTQTFTRARITHSSIALDNDMITAYFDINRIGFYPSALLVDWSYADE